MKGLFPNEPAVFAEEPPGLWDSIGSNLEAVCGAHTEGCPELRVDPEKKLGDESGGSQTRRVGKAEENHTFDTIALKADDRPQGAEHNRNEKAAGKAQATCSQGPTDCLEERSDERSTGQMRVAAEKRTSVATSGVGHTSSGGAQVGADIGEGDADIYAWIDKANGLHSGSHGAQGQGDEAEEPRAGRGAWWYKDVQGKCRGPSGWMEMRKWHRNGHFHGGLPVHLTTWGATGGDPWDGPFVPLSTVFTDLQRAFTDGQELSSPKFVGRTTGKNPAARNVVPPGLRPGKNVGSKPADGDKAKHDLDWELTDLLNRHGIASTAEMRRWTLDHANGSSSLCSRRSSGGSALTEIENFAGRHTFYEDITPLYTPAEIEQLEEIGVILGWLDEDDGMRYQRLSAIEHATMLWQLQQGAFQDLLNILPKHWESSASCGKNGNASVRAVRRSNA